MLLIVEGLDNTGKTTLIKSLRKCFFKSPKTTTIHCVSPPIDCSVNWAYEHYRAILDTCSDLVSQGWDVILDRSHIGEDVFGPIFRGENADYIYDLEYVYLKDIKTYSVLLLDDPEKLVEREDGNSPTVNIDKLTKISDGFIKAFDKSLIDNKMVYHISNEGGFDNLLPKVKKHLLS